jgi:ABC-type sulfate transport system permease subunit
MQQNVGNIEKIARVVLGLGLLSLFFLVSGSIRWIGLAGIVLIATAAIGWCPISSVLGINTCKTK